MKWYQELRNTTFGRGAEYTAGALLFVLVVCLTLGLVSAIVQGVVWLFVTPYALLAFIFTITLSALVLWVLRLIAKADERKWQVECLEMRVTSHSEQLDHLYQEYWKLEKKLNRVHGPGIVVKLDAKEVAHADTNQQKLDKQHEE